MAARDLISVLALAAVATGCSALSAQPDRTRYFVLTPVAASDRPPPSRIETTVGVGPVRIPDSLDRYLVTRKANNEIAISDTDRWADPLRDALGRVLRDNLATLLGTERVVVFPWGSSTQPDVTVEIELLEFERSSGQTAEIKARWSIERGPGRVPVRTQETSEREPIAGTDAEAAAAALSVAIGRLSREIAAAVRESAAT